MSHCRSLIQIDELIQTFEVINRQTDNNAIKSETKQNENENNRYVPADIEDIIIASHLDWYKFKSACSAKETFYIDPESGYKVFTEYAHLQRGKCCGSGCRHCPYSHENVRDKYKINRIQQPAFLYQEYDKNILFNLSTNDEIKVLFHSGGKDSFLTIRCLVQSAKSKSFGLILLTTFDANSRIIAHQDFSIDVIVRQAKHLKISLVGIPIHRGSSETYYQRIENAMNMIKKDINKYPKSLVFGDLHLQYIRDWRDNTLSKLNDNNINLEYPLWNVNYNQLMDDLEKSRVECTISASTVDEIEVGTKFTKTLSEMIVNKFKSDGFGENGEFHTMAQVWTIERECALGL